MYILKTEKSFDSAHFLKGYPGKCGNIHGHRWRILVEVFSEKLKNQGPEKEMVVDFKVLKDDLENLIDYFDHSLIIEKDSISNKLKECLIEENFLLREVEFRPTAEAFSKYFYDKILEKGYKVNKVIVYETPNNSAEYNEGCQCIQ